MECAFGARSVAVTLVMLALKVAELSVPSLLSHHLNLSISRPIHLPRRAPAIGPHCSGTAGAAGDPEGQFGQEAIDGQTSAEKKSKKGCVMVQNPPP